MRMTDETKAAVSAHFDNALLPHRFDSITKPMLRRTPEYAAARAEGRAREWLNSEALSLGYLLAETVATRLQDLDP